VLVICLLASSPGLTPWLGMSVSVPPTLFCPPSLLQVRDGVLYMLDAWIDVSSAATLFPAVAEAVGNPKCLGDGKIAGLQW